MLLAEKTGFSLPSVKAKHIDFGMVTVDWKKRSLKGTLIELEDLLGQAVEKSREILLRKNSNLTEIELNGVDF